MRLITLKSALERICQFLIFVRKDRTGTGKFGAFFPSSEDKESVIDNSDEIAIDRNVHFIVKRNGCNITLRFLAESDGETIATVKKILIASQYQGTS